jgi:predicted RNase H-like HicB family nuclease
MCERVPLPILITKEGKWFVASCPALDIATQGKTEKEVEENMAELINEYLSDTDTAKPSLDDLMSLSLTNIREVRSSKHTTFKKKVGQRVLRGYLITKKLLFL